MDEWVAAIGARRVDLRSVGRLSRAASNFSNADVLVSFGADFLETWGSPVDYAWQFAQMHSYRQGRRGKFVWIGPHRPLTGLNADQWIAPRPGNRDRSCPRARRPGGSRLPRRRSVGLTPETIQQLVQEFRAGNGVALGPGVAISVPMPPRWATSSTV